MSVVRDVSKGKENQEIWILIMPESNQTKSNDKNSGQKKKKNCSRNVFPNQIPKEKVSKHGWENKANCGWMVP